MSSNPDELKLKLTALKQTKKDLTDKIINSNDYVNRNNVIKEIKEIIKTLTEQPNANDPKPTDYCEFNKKNDKKPKKSKK